MTINSSLLGGYADELPAALAQYAATVSGAGAVAAGVAASVTAVESVDPSGIVHRTVLTLANMPQAVVNGTEYQGTEIYDFPTGRIAIDGVVSSLQQKTTSAILSTLNGGSTGAVALGSAAASNTTLSSTMVNLAPSTAFASSTVINVAGAAVTPTLAAAAQFASQLKMYLNSAFATTGDVDADATQTWSGTITITWKNLG